MRPTYIERPEAVQLQEWLAGDAWKKLSEYFVRIQNRTFRDVCSKLKIVHKVIPEMNERIRVRPAPRTKTERNIHIQKAGKAVEIKLYTKLSTLSTFSGVKNGCPMPDGNEQPFCET